MRCPEPPKLRDYLDGALTPRELYIVEKHVPGCDACRRAVALLRAQEELLREALALRPDLDAVERSVRERLRRSYDKERDSTRREPPQNGDS